MAVKIIHWEDGRLTVGYTTIMVLAHINAVDLMLLNLDVEVLLQRSIRTCID